MMISRQNIEKTHENILRTSTRVSVSPFNLFTHIALLPGCQVFFFLEPGSPPIIIKRPKLSTPLGGGGGRLTLT